MEANRWFPDVEENWIKYFDSQYQINDAYAHFRLCISMTMITKDTCAFFTLKIVQHLF